METVIPLFSITTVPSDFSAEKLAMLKESEISPAIDSVTILRLEIPSFSSPKAMVRVRIPAASAEPEMDTAISAK